MRQASSGVVAFGLLLAALLPAAAAFAQGSGQGGEGLSPTLAHIKSANVVHVGYRESSPPFSFLDEAHRPLGYTLELCEAIVEEVAPEVDSPDLKIQVVQANPD